MQRFVSYTFLLLSLLAPQAAYPLDSSVHKQLIVSLAESWSGFHATLYRFEQKGGEWIRVGGAIPAVIGEHGLGWDPAIRDRDPRQPVKKEGDKKAPAGIFPLTLGMGFSPSPPAGATFPYRSIERGTNCVDDVSSSYYNRIVDEATLPGTGGKLWKSSERMWEMPETYRLLIVVGYNTDPPEPGNGSCIFLHIQRSPEQPTSGCTAVDSGGMEEIMKWLSPEASPALVQSTRDAYAQVWRQWRLPPPELLEGPVAQKGRKLVDVRTVAPEVAVDMRYARSDNFTGRTIYECGHCFLRQGTAEKVARAQRELRKRGLSLKMWDCYRPLAVQKFLWSIVPDPRFVANPKNGSRHNRGNAVDVTLVDANGRELEMPTKFDDFSPSASHGEKNLPAKVLENRRLLAKIMRDAGFSILESEWWHYDDMESQGEVLDIPFAELCR